MATDYADYQAVEDILAAIGVPAQATGSNSIASMLASLNTVITNLNTVITNTGDTVTNLAAVVTQIQTGTPSIKNPVGTSSGSNIAIAAGATSTLGPFTVTGTAYTLRLFIGQNPGGALPFGQIQFIVRDGSGNLVDFAKYDFVVGSTSSNTSFIFRGPLTDNHLTINIINNDSGAWQYSYSLNSSNYEPAALAGHTVVPVDFASITGFNIPTVVNVPKGILCSEIFNNVPANSGVLRIIPCCSGEIAIYLNAGTAANAFKVTISPYLAENSFTGTGLGNVITGQTDANGNFFLLATLPRAASRVQVTNTSGVIASGTLFIQSNFGATQ